MNRAYQHFCHIVVFIVVLCAPVGIAMMVDLPLIAIAWSAILIFLPNHLLNWITACHLYLVDRFGRLRGASEVHLMISWKEVVVKNKAGSGHIAIHFPSLDDPVAAPGLFRWRENDDKDVAEHCHIIYNVPFRYYLHPEKISKILVQKGDC